MQTRGQSVTYEVITPDGRAFTNNNPSGNLEWEPFRIVTTATGASDHQTSSLPAGRYKVVIHGMDMQNLNAWRFFYSAAAVTEDGTPDPRPTPSPYDVGDTVWYDANNNATQESGESGIAGVKVNLTDAGGGLISSMTTDTNGKYNFAVQPGTYKVVIDPTNFAAGGKLEGLTSTTGGEQQTNSVTNANVMTYDFGYRGTGSLGDRVWLDSDGDGVQDTSESGIAGVKLNLLLNGNATPVATATTDAAGKYSFSNLAAGSYTVAVDPTTPPAGLVPTFDGDGMATANKATAALTTGRMNRDDVDFGYKGAGSLGDTVWLDSNGNGAFDKVQGEIGIKGVKLTLTADLNGDGTVDYTATATTDGDGVYSFTNLPGATYTVTVDPATLPSGYVQTFDLDGLTSANAAKAALTAAQMKREDVDFGYRPRTSPGTGTPGYWKNHAEAWPVQSIVIGGVTYTKAQAIALMEAPTKGDETMSMIQHIISAKLNAGSGNQTSCIGATIEQADAWMKTNPPGSKVDGKSAAWRVGNPLMDKLDEYNNGRLCAPHRG